MNFVILGDSKADDLEYWVSAATLPSGRVRAMVMALSGDGTLWLDPQAVGIGPEHAPQLAQFPGGKYLLFDPTGGLVLINARAIALLVEDPDWRREWLASVDTLVQEWRKELAMRAAVPNN